MHIGLSQKIFEVYRDRNLEDVCTLEMDMLFGEDSTGSSVFGTMLKGQTLRADVVRVFRDASEPDRARLLAMLQVTQPQMATELLESGELLAYPSEHAAAEATVKRLARGHPGGRYATRGWKTDRQDFPGYSKGEKVMDNTSRYKPALYWTANDLIDPAKGLDSGAFPYCGDDPGPSAPSFLQGSVRSPGAAAHCCRVPPAHGSRHACVQAAVQHLTLLRFLMHLRRAIAPVDQERGQTEGGEVLEPVGARMPHG